MGRKKIFKLRTRLQAEDEASTAPPGRIDEPVVTIQRGSFVFGVCDGCGWEGAGRRSHSSALKDVAAHAQACAKGSMARKIP